MNQLHRYYKIINLLKTNRSVSRERFMCELEVARATLYRDIDFLKNHFQAPILFNREVDGYELDESAEEFSLPGLWINPSEAYALLTMHAFISGIQPGFLEPYIDPLKQRMETMIDESGIGGQIHKRIKIMHMANRDIQPSFFELVSSAVLRRKRFFMDYYVREKNIVTHRHVSPQRLVHYRDNWYLDAFDHDKQALRTFSVESIKKIKLTEEPAENVADEMLDLELGNAYGIFSGSRKKWAKIKFSDYRSRWVSQEKWDDEQKCSWIGDQLILEVPYADDRELIMDILKYGDEAEVLEPVELRQKISKIILKMKKNYA